MGERVVRRGVGERLPAKTTYRLGCPGNRIIPNGPAQNAFQDHSEWPYLGPVYTPSTQILEAAIHTSRNGRQITWYICKPHRLGYSRDRTCAHRPSIAVGCSLDSSSIHDS